MLIINTWLVSQHRCCQILLLCLARIIFFFPQFSFLRGSWPFFSKLLNRFEMGLSFRHFLASFYLEFFRFYIFFLINNFCLCICLALSEGIGRREGIFSFTILNFDCGNSLDTFIGGTRSFFCTVHFFSICLFFDSLIFCTFLIFFFILFVFIFFPQYFLLLFFFSPIPPFFFFSFKV